MGLDLHQLYASEADAVFAFVARMGLSEVEDVVHDTFVTALHRAHTFDASRPARPWLLGIAFRIAVGHLRKSSELPSDEVHERGSSANDPEKTADARRALATVQRVLSTLNDDVGTAFVQHELQGVPVAELARTMKVPPATIYSRIRLAREAFRAAVNEPRSAP